MTRFLKIFLSIFSGAIFLSLSAMLGKLLLFRSFSWYLMRNFEPDHSKIADIATSIVDCTLPVGFGNPYTARFAGYSLVAFTGDDNRSHIYFFQIPYYLPLDLDFIEKQIRQVSGNSVEDRPRHPVVLDQKTGAIRGQEINLVISEGKNSEGQMYREISGLFRGKAGPALVVISQPAASWDTEMVDQFLASIR